MTRSRPTRVITALAGTSVAGALAPALSSLAPRRRPRILPSLCGVAATTDIALTFDDGPDTESTGQILDLLARHKVHATFFVLGRHVVTHPDVVRRTAGEGHEVAVHGWDHLALPIKLPGRLRGELDRTASLIEQLTGSRPLRYRPPFGVLTTEALIAARATGLTTTLWSAWGVDWTARATPESVARTVLRDARPGGTVLLHDSDRCAAAGSWRTTLAATHDLLTQWAREGQTVTSLARRAGSPPHHGKEAEPARNTTNAARSR